MTKPNNDTPAPRQCCNCACFARMLPDGQVVSPHEATHEGMLICQLETPASRLGHKEIPVLKDGQPVMDRGRPRMERVQVVEIGYKPVTPGATCFKGWRPVGTLPGDNWQLQRLLPMVAELARGNTQAAKKLAEGMLADMLADAT